MLSSSRHRIAYAQNVLHDPRLVARLLDRSGIGREDLVVEIGPGTGIITAQLSGRCRRVIAIEKDVALAQRLVRRFAASPVVTVHAGDVLDTPLPATPYKVFANIPFNATAAIVQRLTRARRPPDDAYLVMQKEAAQRFIGQPRASLCAALLLPWFEPSLVYQFRRTDFIPTPQVEAVLLRLRKRGPPLVAPVDAQMYRDFVVHVFTAWKPSLRAALRGLLTPRQLLQLARRVDVELDATPSTVPVEHWLSLFQYVNRVATAPTRYAIAGSEERLRRQQAGLQKRHRTRAPGNSATICHARFHQL